MIEKSSDEGDVVFDPFAGSATTLVACKELNRRYIGCELDDYYYNIALNRLEGFEQSGQMTIFADVGVDDD